MNLFDLYAKLSLDSSDFESGIKRAAGLAKTGLGNIAKVIGAGMAAAATATVAFGASAVKTGAQFDKAMSQVAATLGFTLSELNDKTSKAYETMQTLRDFAQEMGRTTAFSASQAAEALNYMALAGYDAETSMKMLPTVLNLAAAGTMELGHASDMVTDAQTALGLSLDETIAMVDQMAKTASNSNTSVQELGDAFLSIGGTARFMAGGTDRLATVLGVLADNSIKGSEAGTKLRNMILKLSAPTKDGAEMMKQLGLEVYDSEGKMRDFRDIFLDLNAAMADLTEEQRVQAISALFNARDIDAVTALLNTTEERWDELGETILDSKGAAEQMAAVQLDNLAGDITLLKSAYEAMQIVVSDALTPSLREFVQLAKSGLEDVTAAFKADGLEGAMEAFGEWLNKLSDKLIDAVPGLLSAAGKLLSTLASGFAKNLPKLFDVGGKIVKNLLNGMTKALSQTSKQGPKLITEILKSLTSNLGDIAKAGAELVKALATSIGSALPELIPAVVEIITELVEQLTNPESLAAIVDGAIALMTGLAEGLINALPVLLDKLPSIVDNLVTGIVENLPKLVEAAGQIITSLVDYLINPDNWVQIAEVSTKISSIIVDGLGNLAWDLTEVAANFLDALGGAIADAVGLGAFYDAGKGVFGEFVRGLRETAQSGEFAELISSVYSQLASDLESSESLKDIYEAGARAIQTFAQGMAESMPELWGILKGMFGVSGNLTDYFTDYLTDGANEIEEDPATAGAMSKWAQGVTKKAEKSLDEESESFDIGNFVKGLFGKLPEASEESMGDMAEALEAGGETVTGAAESVADSVLSALDISGEVEGIGQAVIDGFASGMESADALGRVTAAAAKAAETASQILKNKLKIKSPSKVTREFGQYFSQGFAYGISDELDLVQDAAEDAARTALGGLGNYNGNFIGAAAAEAGAGSSEYQGSFWYEVKNLLGEIRDNIGGDVVLDSGQVIGFVDSALGTLSTQKARGGFA